MYHALHGIYRREWLKAGRPTPLVVSKARYEIGLTSWEVLWRESPNSCTPIAEYETHAEALAGAIKLIKGKQK